jgi:hypothetical protein
MQNTIGLHDAATLLSLLGYLSLGVLGLTLSTLAVGVGRYYPAMSYAGLAIALVPLWFGITLILRHFDAIAPGVDWKQRTAIVMVVFSSVISALMTIIHVVRERKGPTWVEGYPSGAVGGTIKVRRTYQW